MPPVIVTTDAGRPAAEVFTYATDPARFHEWQAGVTEGHLDHPGPAKVGTRCLTARRIGGASRVVTSEVTHIDPPQAWGIRGIDGPIRATVDLTVAPLTGSPAASRPTGSGPSARRLTMACRVPSASAFQPSTARLESTNR